MREEEREGGRGKLRKREREMCVYNSLTLKFSRKFIYHLNFFSSNVQAMFLAVGHGILYSTGIDLSLRSWQLDAVSELGKVEVNYT